MVNVTVATKIKNLCLSDKTLTLTGTDISTDTDEVVLFFKDCDGTKIVVSVGVLNEEC